MSRHTHKVSKAFILRINDPISIEYAQNAADSCDDVGLKWSYFDGYSHMSGVDAWHLTGIDIPWPKPPSGPNFILHPTPENKANCASAGHGAIWKRIADGPDDAAIVLEHDIKLLSPLGMIMYQLALQRAG